MPSNWKNPSGNYHLGVKNAYELYTLIVKDRVDNDKKDKIWDPAHKAAIADITRKLRVSNPTLVFEYSILEITYKIVCT